MNYYSQAGQDRFVEEVLIKNWSPNGVKGGVFLDVGCGGLEISNTLGLEELGWKGTLIDNSPEAEKASQGRKAHFILADATTFNYSKVGVGFDYLSLDVDGATLNALQQIMRYGLRFRVITIEHDAYRFGRGPREAMRKILGLADYQLICADVRNPVAFEDWWVDKPALPWAKKFICCGKQWQDIFNDNA